MSTTGLSSIRITENHSDSAQPQVEKINALTALGPAQCITTIAKSPKSFSHGKSLKEIEYIPFSWEIQSEQRS
jgi:hypothetical protein